MYDPTRPSKFVHSRRTAWIRNPRTRLEITVHSVRRPRTVDIAFEVLVCVNSYVHIGHGYLTSLLSSQNVSRRYQVFNLKQYDNQFVFRIRKGRTYLASIALLAYPIIEGVRAVNQCSLKHNYLFKKCCQILVRYFKFNLLYFSLKQILLTITLSICFIRLVIKNIIF